MFKDLLVTIVLTVILLPLATKTASPQSWGTRAEMPTPRLDFVVGTATGTDGKARIYAIGGTYGTAATAVVEAYSIDSWATGFKPMPTARAKAAAVTVGGQIMVVGGLTGPNPTNKVEIYDASKDEWASFPDLPQPRSALAAAASGGSVYVFGGSNSNGQPTNSVYKADLPGGPWQTAPSLPTALHDHSAVEKNGKIFIIGGHTDKVWIFDPQASTSPYTAGPDLPQPIEGHVAVVGSNGVLYVMGSDNYNNGNTFAYKLVEQGASSNWVAIPPMPQKGATAGAGARLGHWVHFIGGTYKMTQVPPSSNQVFCTSNLFQHCIIQKVYTGGGGGVVLPNGPVGMCSAPPSEMSFWFAHDGSWDDRINNLHASQIGSVSSVPDRWGGSSAVGVSSNAYLKIKHDPVLNVGMGDFSIDAWVRVPNGVTRVLPIFDKRYTVPNSGYQTDVGYMFYVRNGYISLQTVDGYKVRNTEANTPKGKVADGEWHHVTATADRQNGTVTLYVDGDVATTKQWLPPSGYTLSNNAPAMIGRGYRGERGEFEVDEIELFHRVLAEAEVKTLSGSPKCK